MTTVGAAEITRVTELERWVFAAADLFPEYAAVVGRPADDELVLAIHTYVIRLDGTTVLFDTGNGNDKQRPVLSAHHGFHTDYLERLAAAGVAPEDVDVVVGSHLHPDHCGWNTTLTGDAWVPTFPNARYLFDAAEVQTWRALAADPEAAPIPTPLAEELGRVLADSVEPVFDGGLAQFAEDGQELARADGVTVTLRAAPGHSPGHRIVEVVADDGSGVLLVGDLVHHPLQLEHPDLVQGGDFDPAQARTTREAVLADAAARGLLLLTAHFPGSGAIRVSAASDGRFTAV